MFSFRSTKITLLKPWPNGLASRRKSTQVFDLRSTCVSFGHPLALTCVELKFVPKPTQIFYRLATHRKSTQVDRKSTVYAWNLRLFATCVNLRILLATHRKSIRKFWFASLPWLASSCESVWPGINTPDRFLLLQRRGVWWLLPRNVPVIWIGNGVFVMPRCWRPS